MNKIINVLLWVGAIASVITSIAYIIVMIVFVVGIESALAMNQLLTVAIIGAVAGLSITWMLKMQGVALAANEDESKRIMKEYNDVKYTKDKKPRYRTITYYYIVSGFMDIAIKGVSVGASTYFGYSIFSEGNGDIALIGFALVNVLMFLSFGILALSKAYKIYVTDHLAAIVEKTKRLKLDELASVPVEKVKDELKEYEVPESTTASGAEQEEHRVSGDDVQPDIHNSDRDTRSDIYTNSKLN